MLVLADVRLLNSFDNILSGGKVVRLWFIRGQVTVVYSEPVKHERWSVLQKYTLLYIRENFARPARLKLLKN